MPVTTTKTKNRFFFGKKTYFWMKLYFLSKNLVSS